MSASNSYHTVNKWLEHSMPGMGIQVDSNFNRIERKGQNLIDFDDEPKKSMTHTHLVPPTLPTHTRLVPPTLPTHTRLVPPPLPRFVSNKPPVPELYHTQFDTEGPYSGCERRGGPPIPVTYVRNGRTIIYEEAFWTSVYPRFVAAGSEKVALQLEARGYNVLPWKLSHDARCHWGGTAKEQCTDYAMRFEPCCASLHNNKEAIKQYGKLILEANYIDACAYETRKVIVLKEGIAKDKLYIQSTYQGGNLVNLEAIVDSISLGSGANRAIGGHRDLINMVAKKGCFSYGN